MRITQHAKMRMKERIEGVNSFDDAERIAKIAYRSGVPYQKIEDEGLQIRCEKLKRGNKNATIKVYRDNLYLFKGSKEKTLVTVIPCQKDENMPQRVYMGKYLMNWEEINQYESAKRKKVSYEV